VIGKIRTMVGRALAGYLTRPSPGYRPVATSDVGRLAAALRPCDVLLVEGNLRISTAIKYLTQSTWSHAALYVGDAAGGVPRDPDTPLLVEADLVRGVQAVPLSKYADFHTRICRPVGLDEEDRRRVIGAVIARIEHTYDLQHVFDLARYLLPTPPVPTRWRRRMIQLGSGDPTKAICSTLIAQAFQSVRYPILPLISRRPSRDPGCDTCVDEILHIRHYSLFAPRDFDISPYFQVVKPTVEAGFDYRALHWDDPAPGGPAAGV
jgi:hypothetical protein